MRGIFPFVLYMYGRIQEPYELYSVFFSAIAVLYPFIISIVCGMSASVEEQAGHFQMMLAVPYSKIVSFAGKLLLLLLLNVLSAGLAICLYLAGMKFVLHINDLPYLTFLKGGAWLIAGSIPLYMMSFCRRKVRHGTVRAFRGAGLLIAALMNTGLGDIIWRFSRGHGACGFQALQDCCILTKSKRVPPLCKIRYEIRRNNVIFFYSDIMSGRPLLVQKMGRAAFI